MLSWLGSKCKFMFGFLISIIAGSFFKMVVTAMLLKHCPIFALWLGLK